MKLLLKPGLEFSDGKSAIYGLSRRPVEALRACVSVGQPRNFRVRFAKQNAEAGFTLASSLANAKDIQDVLALQTHYAQSQMQTYALQVQELGRSSSRASRQSTS